MGTLTFQIPAGLSRDAVRELERTCMAGGPDNMPWPTELRFTSNNQLIVTRAVEESGYLVAPWPIEGFGQLMGTSATLMERPREYNLLVELTRGKVNQVRCQLADWQAGGLVVPPGLQQQVQEATRTFGRSVTAGQPEEASQLAQMHCSWATRLPSAWSELTSIRSFTFAISASLGSIRRWPVGSIPLCPPRHFPDPWARPWPRVVMRFTFPCRGT